MEAKTGVMGARSQGARQLLKARKRRENGFCPRTARRNTTKMLSKYINKMKINFKRQKEHNPDITTFLPQLRLTLVYWTPEL